jgi:hypothetical protein
MQSISRWVVPIRLTHGEAQLTADEPEHYER